MTLSLAGLLLSLAAFQAGSSPTATVSGVIVEAGTAAPLEAAIVRVQATGQEGLTDAEGRFAIGGVPVGAQTLVVSVVGYGLTRRDVVVPAAGLEGVVVVVVEGTGTYTESVIVRAPAFRQAEAGVSGQSVLGSRDLLALRGVLADDPFRAVQALPEVTTGDDFRGEFAVRGLGPTHTGLAVDGVDTPLLFHTVRGVNDTGSLALINTDILEPKGSGFVGRHGPDFLLTGDLASQILYLRYGPDGKPRRAVELPLEK